MTEQELIEQLADKEHASWARWMAYLFEKCEEYYDGDGYEMLAIPRELVTHWKRQVATPYSELSEREKQSDREEVAHILPIIEKYVSGKLTNAVVKTITSYGTVSQPLARENRQHLDK